MIQLRLKESQLMAARREIQEAAERWERRAHQLDELIPKTDARLQELRVEQEDVRRRLDALIGDEANGRPGLVHVLNEQINLFDAEHGPKPSASLGRRGHSAPLAAVPMAAAPR